MGNLDIAFEHETIWKATSQRYIPLYGFLDLKLTGANIVDIGCGSGGLVRALRRIGANAVGFDLDRKKIEYGKQFTPHIFVGDALEGLVDDQHARDLDLITLNGVFEHLWDPAIFLQQLHKAISNSETRVFVSVPNLNHAHLYCTNSFSQFLQAHLHQDVKQQIHVMFHTKYK